MVALARVQRKRAELVILCPFIVGNMSVTLTKQQLKFTISRPAWEIHQMVINAKSLDLAHPAWAVLMMMIGSYAFRTVTRKDVP